MICKKVWRVASLAFMAVAISLFDRVAAEPKSLFENQISNWYTGLDKTKVLYAVNCGGESELTDDSGVTFMADRDYSGGQTTAGCGMHRWPMTNMNIYHAERWGEKFSYNIPINDQRDGHFTLVLKFSECYFWEPGMKVFDVIIGD